MSVRRIADSGHKLTDLPLAVGCAGERIDTHVGAVDDGRPDQHRRGSRVPCRGREGGELIRAHHTAADRDRSERPS